MQDYEYLLSKIDYIKGVGKKTLNLFAKKNIITIFDLLWHLPISQIETSKVININDLQIGKFQTINTIPIKYNFPRIRNLPNKVVCEHNNVRLDCIFFNSYEGYIKKILPLGNETTINGKVGYYKGKYQIVNPTQILKNDSNIINHQNKYSLTEGLNSKKYNIIINKVLKNLPDLDEWHRDEILKEFDNVSWKDSVIKIHNRDFNTDKNSKYLRRLIFDEVFSHFLISSKLRTKIKKIKKKQKIFNTKQQYKIIKSLNFKLTKDQNNSIKTINALIT